MADDASSQPLAAAAAAPAQPSLSTELSLLFLKIALFAAVFVALFSFVFGAARYDDISMAPNVDDGDMVISYRLDKRYAANQAIVFNYDGRRLVGRVVAVAGDTVDITADGLRVNGSLVEEDKPVGKTTQVKGGVTFPLTVGEGQVFVLGDNREEAIDSRTFGCVDIDRTEGRVLALFRTRGV